VPEAIVVVDDGSEDDTGEVARAAGATVVRVDHSGPGLARAAGARAAPAVRDPGRAVLLFTDADCVAHPEFVARMVGPIFGGRADAAKGAYTTDQRGLIPRFVQIEFTERYRRLAGLDGTDFADGHAAAYRRSAFEEAGGFDTRLRLSQNVDLAYRLSERGRRIEFVPDALVTHRHPESMSAYARAKAERSFWRARSLWRHPRKAVVDSYTPASLKVQMVSLAVASGAVLAGAFGVAPEWAGLLVVDAGLVFLGSAVPLLRLAWAVDRPAAAMVVPMLLVRAAALLTGTSAGLVAGLDGLLAAQPVHGSPLGTAAGGLAADEGKGAR
jgi:hypothetical protein